MSIRSYLAESRSRSSTSDSTPSEKLGTGGAEEYTSYTVDAIGPSSASVWMGLRGSRGRRVDLTMPQPQDFQPEEIARTLAYVNRYAGQYGAYSVAQHAVLVAQVLKAMRCNALIQLAGLHHDDTEAVTSDIPQPVKSVCADLRRLEQRLQECVNLRYMIDVNGPEVRKADHVVFYSEVQRLVPADARWMYDCKPSRLVLTWTSVRPWGPDEAFAQYMDLHEELSDEADALLSGAASEGGVTA